MSGQLTRGERALIEAGQHVSSARSDLTGQIGTLRGRLSSLGTRWQGVGAASFTSVMQRWEEQQRALLRILDQLERDLLDTDRDLGSTDEQQSQYFAQHSARLG